MKTKVRNVDGQEVLTIGDWAIKADEYCYQVSKIAVVKPNEEGKKGNTPKYIGKEYLSSTTYHRNLPQAIERILNSTERELWPDLDKIIESHKALLAVINDIKDYYKKLS